MPPQPNTATSAEAKPTASAGLTRRRKAVSKPLTGTEYRRRQRLRLVQIARRSAAVAAELLLADAPCIPPPSSPKQQQLPTAESNTTASRGPTKAKKGVQAQAEEGSKYTAATLMAPENENGEKKTDASAGGCGPVEAVPCSYAQLWRGLLQLRFPEMEEEEADHVTSTDTKKAPKTTRKTAANLSVGRGAQRADTATFFPVKPITSLVEELQASDKEWRETLLLGTKRSFPFSRMRESGASALNASLSGAFGHPHATTLTRDEAYTLRRYAERTVAMPPQSSATQSECESGTAAETRAAKRSDGVEARFFMDAFFSSQ